MASTPTPTPPDIGDAEARMALDTVEHRRQQVLAEIDVPGWYWWFLALGWVAVGAAVEFGGAVGAILAPVVFGAVHAGPLAGAERPLPDRQPERAQDVAGHQVLFAVIAYVVVLCVVTLVVALAANADGARHPGMFASVVVALLVLAGGPRLMAALRRRRARAGAGMTEPRFDELIHPSTRLSIVALLASADWIDFAYVRDQLGLSDSALSKQFSTLEEAGYLTVHRRVSDRRRRVRVRLTREGRPAFDGHVAALRAVVAMAESETTTL